MNNRHSTEKREIENRNIGDGYVVVRRSDSDGRLAAPLDGSRGLYIPFTFEAGIFKPAFPEVWLTIRSAHSLRQVYEAAGHEPPTTFRDPVVHRVVVISDAFASVPLDLRIPLATYARLALAAAAGTWQEITTGELRAGDKIEDWREQRVSFADIARRPVGRPRLDKTIDLAEVRKVVRDGGVTPTKAVQDHFHVSRTTALRYRRAAGV